MVRPTHHEDGGSPIWDDSTYDTWPAQAFREPFRAVVGSVLLVHVAEATGILEIGCGAGTLLDLAPDAYRTRWTQTDADADMVTQASERWPDVRSLVASAGSLDGIEDESVGAVVAMDVLDIVEDPALVMRAVARVLRPGGTFIHFHDRMPAPWHILNDLQGQHPEAAFLPYVAKADVESAQYRVFDALQIVRPQELAEWLDLVDMDVVSRAEVAMAMSDPFGYVATFGYSKTIELSDGVQILARHFTGEAPVVTPAIIDLFHDLTSRTAEYAGMQAVDAPRIVEADATVSREPVSDILRTRIDPIDSLERVEWSPIGAMRSSLPHLDAPFERLDPADIQLAATLQVFVARKPIV